MISAALGYARSRLVVLGYTEWDDGFNSENIPRTLLDRSFHLTLGDCSNRKNSHDNLEIDCPVSVELYRAQNRKPKDLIDTGVGIADTVMADILNAANRLTYGNGLMNVTFQTMRVIKSSDSNDNSLRVQIDLIMTVIISTV